METQAQASLTAEELRALTRAKTLLENPGLTARLAGMAGRPIERGFAALPKEVSDAAQKAVRAALFRALEMAIFSLGPSPAPGTSEFAHKVLAGASGILGGAFGLPAALVELPVSTTLMLRSIAEIARAENHDLRSPEIKLACLEVFALGGTNSRDDAAESAYWTVRAVLANAISEAAAYLAERALVDKGSPVLLRLITAIASRFGVMVSEQLAAKAVPVVGAAGGSVINVLFMNHFQAMARGHFIVKRLERIHGEPAIREIYSSIAVPAK